jgi:hypothetical protein
MRYDSVARKAELGIFASAANPNRGVNVVLGVEA